MSSIRLPIFAAGLLAVFATTLGQAGCSDSDTTSTGDTTTSTTTTTSTAQMMTTTTTGGNGGSGAQGGGGQGGGGNMNTGTDACPGDAITIDIGFGDSFVGDTAGAADDYESVCEIDSGPEMVYQLNIASDGVLDLSVLALDGQDLSVYLREACTASSSAVFCRNHDALMESRGWKTYLDAGTYYLFIDTEGQTGGGYALDLLFSASICGDTVVGPGEQCDDGNGDTGDGCASCMLEAGSNDTCADPQVELLPAGLHTFSGTTLGNAATYAFNDTTCGVAHSPPGAPDRVFEFVPQVTGDLRLRLGWDETNMGEPYCNQPPDFYDNVECLESVLHVRHAAGQSGPAVCSNVANQIVCEGTQTTFLTNDVTFPVTANESYYVFIDSYYDGAGFPNFVAGPYDLNVELTPGSGGGGGAGGAGGGGGAGGN